jgi:hypothetical protein
LALVAQGKHFEIEVEGDIDEDALARIRDLADTLLANPVRKLGRPPNIYSSLRRALPTIESLVRERFPPPT